MTFYLIIGLSGSKSHIEEICENLGIDLDGLFFDIIGIRPCWCMTCLEEMKSVGVDETSEEAVRVFAKSVIDRFKNNLTQTVREYSKDCTVFYNAGHIGPCTMNSADAYTHFELESLPSGFWGYKHFPVTACYTV